MNTGHERKYSITIIKTVGGETLEGYPHKYGINHPFHYNGKTYSPIHPTKIAEMPLSEFMERWKVFKKYIEEKEGGIDIDISDIRIENKTDCPIK